eukprot:m.105943 g.105943  ORF g.105943 m.105943 type:complete len:50 (+) comp13290_c0_seq6:51-200(+)
MLLIEFPTQSNRCSAFIGCFCDMIVHCFGKKTIVELEFRRRAKGFSRIT